MFGWLRGAKDKPPAATAPPGPRSAHDVAPRVDPAADGGFFGLEVKLSDGSGIREGAGAAGAHEKHEGGGGGLFGNLNVVGSAPSGGAGDMFRYVTAASAPCNSTRPRSAAACP